MLDGHADRERIVAMAMVGGQADPHDLDTVAVSDRFRLFNFTRRDTCGFCVPWALTVSRTLLCWARALPHMIAGYQAQLAI